MKISKNLSDSRSHVSVSSISKRECFTKIRAITTKTSLFSTLIFLQKQFKMRRKKQKAFTIAHSSNNVLRRYRCFFRKIVDVVKDLPIFSSSSFTGSQPLLKEKERRRIKKKKLVYDLPLLLRRNHKIFNDSK